MCGKKGSFFAVLLWGVFAVSSGAGEPAAEVTPVVGLPPGFDFASIRERALVANRCKLSPDEARAALCFELESKHIGLESFRQTATMMTKLIEALRLVVIAKQNPDAVYREMKLETFGLTPGNWKFYVERYRTPEQIGKLEEIIPNRMEVVIESGYQSFKPLVERWLLEQRILGQFERREDLSFEDKRKAWWDDFLKPDIPDAMRRKLIASHCAMVMASPFDEEESARWTKWFRDRRIAAQAPAADNPEKKSKIKVDPQ